MQSKKVNDLKIEKEGCDCIYRAVPVSKNIIATSNNEVHDYLCVNGYESQPINDVPDGCFLKLEHVYF